MGKNKIHTKIAKNSSNLHFPLMQVAEKSHTVVWNDYLLIFSQKCHILFHKKVGSSLQIIKYINLSRFQHILKL